MWGSFIKNAAALASEQASSLVGRVDEIATQGLSTASQFLEKLDGLGNEAEGGGAEHSRLEAEPSESEATSASSVDLPPAPAEEPANSVADTSLEASRLPPTEPQRQKKRRDAPKAAELAEGPPAGSGASIQSLPSNASISAADGAESPAPPKTADAKKYQGRIKKLEKEKTELEEEVSNLQIAVASLSKELQEALSTAQQDRLHEQWAKEKEELNSLLAAQEEKLAADRQQREQVTAQQQLALSLLQEEKKAMQAKLAKLEGLVEENKALRSELKAVRDRCSEVEALRDQLQVSLADMAEQLQRQQASNHHSLSAFEDERRVLNERLQQLSSENEGYSSQISQLQHALENLRGEQAEVVERLQCQATAASQQRAEELAEEYARLEAQQAALQDREDESNAARRALEDKLTTLQAEFELVRAERCELQEQVDSFRAAAEAATAALPDSKPSGSTKSDKRKKKGSSAGHSIYSTHVESAAPSSHDNGREEAGDSNSVLSGETESPPPPSQSSELHILQAQLQDMQQEKQKLQALYNKSLQQCDEMLQERERLQMQNQDWCEKYAAAGKEIATLANLNAELESACGDLRQQLQSLAEKEASSEREEKLASPVVELKKKQLEAQLAELEQALEQDDRRPSQDLASPSDRMEALSSQLHKLKQERSSLKSRCGKLQAELFTAQEQLLLAKEEIEASRAEHMAYRASLLQSLQEQEALSSSLSAQIETLTADASASEANGNATISGLQQAQENLREQLAVSAQEVQQWKDRTAQLEQAMQAVDGERQAWQLERQQLEDAQREQLAASERQWEATGKEELRVQQEVHESNTSALQAELDRLRASYDALSERLAAAQQASDGTASLQQVILSLQTENDRLEAQYNENLAQYKTLLDENGALQIAASNAEEGRQAAQQVVDKLEEQCRKESKALTALAEQHDQLQDELLQCQQDLSQEQARSQEATQALAQARQELHELRERGGQVVELKAEVGKLREKLHQSISTKNELDGERKLLADDKTRLQSMVTTLEGEREQAVQDALGRQRALEQAEKRVQALEKAQADWQQQHTQLTHANEHLTEQNANLQRELNDLRAQWEDLRGQYAHTSASHQQLEAVQREHADLASRHQALQEQLTALQEAHTKQQAALNAFEGKKKKDLENLRKQNETISSLNSKVASLQAMETDFQTLQARYHALEEQYHTAVGEIAQLREDAQKVSAQNATQHASRDTEMLAATQRAQQLEQFVQSQAKELEQAKETLSTQQRQWQEQYEGLLLQLQQERALAAPSSAASGAEGGAKEAPTAASQPPSVDNPELLELRQLVQQQKVQLGDLLAERKDLLSQVETTQQQLAHYFQHSVYNSSSSSASSGGQGAQMNGNHAHSGYDEERGMLLDSQKKDLAGASPSLIQMWTMFRQHCPGPVVAALPERPPRMTLAAQVSIVYGVLLQIAVVYQYMHCH